MLLQIYYYQNFSFPTTAGTLQVLVWALYAGVMLGAIAATLDKYYCLGLIKAMVKAEANAPERAVTLESLDVKGKWYLGYAMRSGKPLRKMLAVPEGAETKKTKELPVYLPEEKRPTAETRYDNGPRPIRSLIIAAAALTAVAFFVLFAVPELLTMLDNFITMINEG